MPKSFEDFDIWQNAHRFVLSVYKATRSFPAEERFALTSQFRRAAVSVPANIAEGYSRFGAKEKARFFNIAEASLDECHYYCILSNDLGYPTPEDWKDAIRQLKSQIASYNRVLREQSGEK